MRFAPVLFTVVILGCPVLAQPFDPPPPKTPDAATLERIKDETARLRAAVAAASPKVPGHAAELEVYVKAAEWIVRHQEWFTADSGKQTLAVIEQGIERAEAAKDGKTPWLDAAGRSVARGYRSRIDGSVQPYGVVYPHGYGDDKTKKWRLDVHLHGRDSSLTEVKHLFQHAERVAPKEQDYVQLNIYGRGNNAYRWAGEADVFEAMEQFLAAETAAGRKDSIDRGRIVLKGFSMGGAGTWHIGLRHPDRFRVLQPGAGFTTTHGYVPKLSDPLPDYQEKCLTIYDAYRYGENAWNVPVVAYSGEKDRQKQAADLIERELEKVNLKSQMIHLVAPGLEHRFPPDWQRKAETEVRKRAATGRSTAYRIKFRTYTLRTNSCEWVTVHRLGRHYERASVDVSRTGSHPTLPTANAFAMHTTNVTAMELGPFPDDEWPRSLAVDGEYVTLPKPVPRKLVLAKSDGKWAVVQAPPSPNAKRPGVQGPIDDAFTGPFLCVGGTGKALHSSVHESAQAQLDRFRREWDKFMRGELPVKKDTEVTEDDLATKNLILFGDPGSNSLIARALPKLPITWTAEALVFAGTRHDAATHLPILIQPSPFSTNHYVVLNSGHTFHEADFKGTNALLYPRLGDFAVVKPTPTAKDAATFEVVAAGLFDEEWKFPKK